VPPVQLYETQHNLEFYLLLEGEAGSVPDDEDEVASFNEISTEVRGVEST
jgi:hypothetical protein